MIVVLGANGFLGRHLCSLLERDRHQAVAVSRRPDSRFFNTHAPSLSLMTEADLFSTSGGREVLSLARAVVCLNWRSVPVTFATEPWREVPENVEPAMLTFWRLAEAAPAAKIVFLSSGGTVYGAEGTTPRTELSPTHPISAYGLGKLLTEEALRFVGRARAQPYAILRVSNAVGRWQTNEAQGIVGAALRAARGGTPLKLYGGGKQIRDFVDADDVARAIFAACNDSRQAAATWNVGSGTGVTIADLVGTISEIIGKQVPVEIAAARGVDVPYVVLNCEKIADELGWLAKVPIEQSILELWRIMEDRL